MKKLPSWPSEVSSAFDATEKSIPMPKQPRMSLTPSIVGGPSPPHSTTPGGTCCDPLPGLMVGAPTPPESDTNDDSRWLRDCASWSVNSAPALTPTLDTQFWLTVYCASTHASMSSKNMNSSSMRCGDCVMSNGHLVLNDVPNTLAPSDTGATAMNRC